MTTSRQFCRFNRGVSTTTGQKDASSVTTREIPEGGLCLSSFLILSNKSNPIAVLMGHLNPAAPWDEIGALDKSRIDVHSKGWMLPSCHLMIGEAPEDAARRIAREQLGLGSITLPEAKVVSEVSTPKRFPNLASHWDIEFIFKTELEQDTPPKNSAWKELQFVPIDKTPKSSIARSHEDIIESAGLQFKRN